jgi:hypothetical protein
MGSLAEPPGQDFAPEGLLPFHRQILEEMIEQGDGLLIMGSGTRRALGRKCQTLTPPLLPSAAFIPFPHLFIPSPSKPFPLDTHPPGLGVHKIVSRMLHAHDPAAGTLLLLGGSEPLRRLITRELSSLGAADAALPQEVTSEYTQEKRIEIYRSG